MKKVFIDGSVGTTGLRIHERLAARDDVELIALPEELRKNERARKEALNAADVAFLCLPDDAAREAAAMVENEHTVVIDTSTAHRTSPQWAYGFPELGDDFREKIVSSKRIAVPGCHASGFIALVQPLVQSGLLAADEWLTCHSITGYSGGGKKMIAEYQAEERAATLVAPRQYALTQRHKHLKEMKAIGGLEHEPIFCPIVSDFYSGMTVTVPLFQAQLGKFGTADVRKLYAERYVGPLVQYAESVDENGFISAASLSGRDGMRVTVAGNEERILLVAVYDNLGKGASGAAIECMNLVCGVEPTKGLLP